MKVSVLLCTHNSRALLPIAIESYLSQDYENKELMVIDDGDDLIADMVKGIPGVHYHLVPAQNLAEKRNVAIRLAKGDIIVHFDSDDWSGPQRIVHQVKALGNHKVVGYNKAWWYDTRRKVATYASCGLWGATLCYDRQWALEHPWDETQTSCEDAWFLMHTRAGELEGGENFVALAHEGNAPRPFGEPGWRIIGNEMLPEGFTNYWRKHERSLC